MELLHGIALLLIQRHSLLQHLHFVRSQGWVFCLPSLWDLNGSQMELGTAWWQCLLNGNRLKNHTVVFPAGNSDPRSGLEAAAPTSVVNVVCFTQKLVDKLYSGMFAEESKQVLIFIAEQIMEVSHVPGYVSCCWCSLFHASSEIGVSQTERHVSLGCYFYSLYCISV